MAKLFTRGLRLDGTEAGLSDAFLDALLGDTFFAGVVLPRAFFWSTALKWMAFSWSV